jgi:dipeptide/tripeptide permease
VIRSQIFINVTSYEIAYTRAPQRMKGVVFAIVLFMSAVSSAITLAISPSFVDPNLIWPFVGLAAGLVVCAILIWLRASFLWLTQWALLLTYIFPVFHKMDDEEASVLAIGTTRKIEGTFDPKKK